MVEILHARLGRAIATKVIAVSWTSSLITGALRFLGHALSTLDDLIGHLIFFELPRTHAGRLIPFRIEEKRLRFILDAILAALSSRQIHAGSSVLVSEGMPSQNQ